MERTTRVRLAPRQTHVLTTTGTMPPRGQTRIAHLRATPLDESGFSTYATLIVTAGAAPAEQPLAMPIVLKPYRHENEQFGHRLDLPVENQVYFDVRNRPFVRTSTGLAMLEGGKWSTTVVDAGSTPACSKISFDRDNRVYLLATAGRTTA